MIRFTSALAAMFLGVMPVQAATFDVMFEGTIFDIVDLPPSPEFRAAAPFEEGDDVTFTVRIDTSLVSVETFDQDPSVRYVGGVTQIDADFNGYTFSQAIPPVPRDWITINGGPGEADRVAIRRDVDGAALAGYTPLLFEVILNDTSGDAIFDNELGPDKFTTDFYDPKFGDERDIDERDLATLLFQAAPNEPIWVVAELTDHKVVPAPSAVPLPASLWLLAFGLGVVGTFKRKVTS